MSADLAALRSYVTYDSGAQNKADTTVLLTVTHSNLKARFLELRFDTHVRRPAPAAPPPACGRACNRAGPCPARSRAVPEKWNTNAGRHLRRRR